MEKWRAPRWRREAAAYRCLVCPFDGSLTMTSPPMLLPPQHLRTADWVHVSSRHTKSPKRCSVFHLGWYWLKISRHLMLNPGSPAVEFRSPGCRTTCLSSSHRSLALGLNSLKCTSFCLSRLCRAPFTLKVEPIFNMRGSITSMAAW